MKKDPRPTLILFCGLPGSGKTTLAKQLEKQGEGIRICTDDWQNELGMNHNENDFHRKLREKLYAHTLELLGHGQSVILEDGLWTVLDRNEKLTDASKHGAKTELHFFDLTFNQLWNRLNARNRNLPNGAVHIEKESLKKCWNKFEKPSSEELAAFDTVFVYKSDAKHPSS